MATHRTSSKAKGSWKRFIGKPGGKSKLAFKLPDPSVSESSRSIARSDAPRSEGLADFIVAVEITGIYHKPV